MAPPPGARPAPDLRRAPGVIALLGVLFMATVAGSWWMTGAGMVVTPDSASYLSTAQHLADGQGLTSDFAPDTSTYTIEEQLELDGRVPLTEWPPLYPAVLGGGAVLGPDPLEVARVVNAFALGATAVLGALLIRRAVDPPPLVLAATALLVVLGPVQVAGLRLLSVPLVGQSAFVLSETLFLPLLLGALLVGARIARDGRRALVAAVALVGAATLTRYVGVAAGAGAAAMVLADPSAPGRGRVRRAVALLVTGPAAILLWAMAQRVVWGSGGGEVLAWHPPGTDALGDLVDVAGGWFLLPPSWPAPLRALLLLVAVAVPVSFVVRELRRGGARGAARGAAAPHPVVPVLVGLLTAAAGVLAVLVVTMVLVDANVPFAQRTLAPVQVLLQLAWVCVLYRWLADRPAWAPTTAVGVAALVLCAGSIAGLDEDRAALAESVRTAAAQRAGSPLRDLPGDAVVVTNEPARAWGETDAQVLLAPQGRHLVSDRPNSDYEDELRAVGALLGRRTGVVAHHPGLLGGDLPADLERVAGLVPIDGCGDAPELLTTPERVGELTALLRC